MLVTDHKKPLNLIEIGTLRVAMLINFGWSTIACVLGVSVCFKKFETHFDNEAAWAISVLAIIFCVFTANSWIYGQLLYGGVFVFASFSLYDKYNRLCKQGSFFENVVLIFRTSS